MILVCPSCSTKYRVAADVVPSEGRRVRCKNCGENWWQEAPVPASGAETDLDAAKMAAAISDHAAVKSNPQPESQFGSQPRPRPTAMIAFLVVAALGLTAAGLYVYKGRIAEAAPRAASALAAYSELVDKGAALLGRARAALPIEPKPDFKISRALYDFDETKQGRVLLVSGEVINQGDAAGAPPRLDIIVRDATGNELYRWSISVDAAKMEAGQKAGFFGRLIYPPDGAAQIAVDFKSQD